MSTRRLFFTLSLLSMVLLTIGCSKTPVETTTVVEEPNLTDEFGGYQPYDETPGFDNDELLTAASESEVEYDDPYLAGSGLDSILKDPNAGHYHLRLIWGRLRYDSTSTTPTDWTGSLSITRGVEILRRTIRFEPNQDYIQPRKDRRLIEWVSQTTVHNDGIAVDIFVPPVKPLIDTSRLVQVDSMGNEVVIIVVDTTWPVVEPVKVEFKTSPYSRTFDLRELAALDTIVYLEDSIAVCFQAIKLDRFPCPRGFLAGGWGFNEEGQGVFRGVWMDRFGRVDGFLKGHFGTTEEGKMVFFGKWITRFGRFSGFIRGHWGFAYSISNDPASTRFPMGYFRGQIYTSDGKVIGALAGKFYGANALSNVAMGYFQGRWKLYCTLEVNSEGDDGF
ncbi:MAG: hypothetical protein ACREBV_01070 [Candidatus Zixiibacteriota bacterium]